jgi:hypothetical protein
MSNIVLRKRRGTTIQLSTLVSSPGELYIDLTKPTVVVHDGSTPGGIPLAKEVHSHPIATELTGGFLSSTDKTKLDALSVAGGVQNILSNTTPLPQESTINFSTDFTVVDNPGASRTDFSISSNFLNTINSNAIALIVALS